MHNRHCGCRRCTGAGIGTGSFETEVLEHESEGGFGEIESELSEEEEVELALELLTVSSEAELDQFLGKLFKGAWKGIKKVGSVVGKIAKPLGGVLRAVAKKALPLVGGALGSFIPIPGVGTAVGSALGGAISKALEAETGRLNAEDRELEIARRFVRIATHRGATGGRGAAGHGRRDRRHAGGRRGGAQGSAELPVQRRGRAPGPGAQQGRWIRRGRQVVLLGA